MVGDENMKIIAPNATAVVEKVCFSNLQLATRSVEWWDFVATSEVGGRLVDKGEYK